MKKWLILLSVSLFSLTSPVSAENLLEKLISRGISVANLTDEDEINIQLSKLEQAIQQQNRGVIYEMLSADYSEENHQFKKDNIKSILSSSFSAISTARNIPSQPPGKTGWRKTASSDFIIRNPKIVLNKEKDKAEIECDLAFFSIEGDTVYKEENHRNIKDKLVFVKKIIYGTCRNLMGCLVLLKKSPVS